jgi:hypothetical protein
MEYNSNKTHVHDFLRVEDLPLPDDLRDMKKRGVQMRTCECGEWRLYVQDEEGIWEQYDKKDPIYELIDFG